MLILINSCIMNMENEITPMYWEDAISRLSPQLQSSGNFLGLSITWREICLLIGVKKMFRFYKDNQENIVVQCPYCGAFVDDFTNERCPDCKQKALLFL